MKILVVANTKNCYPTLHSWNLWVIFPGKFHAIVLVYSKNYSFKHCRA